MPPSHAGLRYNRYNASLHILAVVANLLTVPPRAGQAPEVRKIGESAVFQDVPLSRRRLDFAPGVCVAVVGIQLDQIGGVEQGCIFVLNQVAD